MPGETSATFNVSGIVTFQEAVEPERAEELLRALGAFGIDLHLQASRDQDQMADIDAHNEVLPERFVGMMDVTNFARRNNIPISSAAKAWNAAIRVFSYGNLDMDADPRIRRAQAHRGDFHITEVSLGALRDLIAVADSVAPPGARSKQIRQQRLSDTLRGGLGPISVDFLRGFVAEAETDAQSAVRAEESFDK